MATNPNITIGGNQLHGVASGGGIGVGAGTNAPNNADVKSYVDAVAQGLKTKGIATAVVLANVASLTGLAAVGDGVTLGTDGMIALLTAQTTGSQNGAWIVHSGAWTRPANFAAGSSAAGAFWIVEQGTLYHDTGWVCSTDPPSDVVDTNSLALSMFFSATALSNADGTLVFTGTDVRRAAITGDVSIPAGSNTGTLASVVTAATVGDASHVSQATVNVKGLVTALTSVPIAIDTAAVTTGTFVAGRMPGFTGGDVTSSPGSLVLTIGASTVTLAKMANLAAQRLLGNDTGTGAPVAISVGQGIAFTGSAALANTLITGLSGGQTITGGTSASDPLTIRATSNATAGTVTIGGGVDGSGIALALNNGNSTGPGGTQVAFGYNGAAQFRQSIRTRHNSGAGPGNGIDVFTWTPADGSAIGSVRALTIEAAGIGVPSLAAGGIASAAVTTGILGIAANSAALVAVSGTNTGDQTITLTGDVTGSGTGSFPATIANGAVTLAKMANLAAQRLLGNDSSSGAPNAIAVGAGAHFSGGFNELDFDYITGVSVDASWRGSTVSGKSLTIDASFGTDGGPLLMRASRWSFDVVSPIGHLAASTEQVAWDHHDRLVTWSTGALPTQRETVFRAPTYAFAAASTITTAATVAITGAPFAGTNATITTPLALLVESGNASVLGGRLGVGTATPSYALEVLGMTRHSGATGINANPDAEAAMYLQAQITGDRDRIRFRFGGAGTALPTTGTTVGYVMWSPSSTTIADAATVAAIHTHILEVQTVSLGAGATITDSAPATLNIKGPPNFLGAGTPPTRPRAIRVEAGDISVDSGSVIAFQFQTNSLSANTTITPDTAVFGGSVEITDGLVVDHDLNVVRDAFFTKSIGVWGHGGFASQPTVTGSRGGNAALASLLGTLATYGLIIDSSS